MHILVPNPICCSPMRKHVNWQMWRVMALQLNKLAYEGVIILCLCLSVLSHCLRVCLCLCVRLFVSVSLSLSLSLPLFYLPSSISLSLSPFLYFFLYIHKYYIYHLCTMLKNYREYRVRFYYHWYFANKIVYRLWYCVPLHYNRRQQCAQTNAHHIALEMLGNYSLYRFS